VIEPSELEVELRRQWPVLYHVPIDCGAYLPKGWYPLIRELSEELEPFFAEFDRGSRPIVQQIKTKFGGLRFYISRGTQEIHDVIARAEERAEHTCMNCGSDGNGRIERGVMSTMCESCFHGQCVIDTGHPWKK
jgi:hypothetical protein